MDDETFANMKERASNLQRLSIELSTTMDYQDDYEWWFDYDNGLCAETLRKGLLRDFVTSSPLLEDLDITFSSASSNPGIQDAVGNFHLAYLKDARFDEVYIDADDLVEFSEDMQARSSSFN